MSYVVTGRKIMVRYQTNEDPPFNDALYYDAEPTDEQIAADVESRLADREQRAAEAADMPVEDAPPAPEPSAQDRLNEARGLLARLDELKQHAQLAVDQMAAAADEGS